MQNLPSAKTAAVRLALLGALSLRACVVAGGSSAVEPPPQPAFVLSGPANEPYFGRSIAPGGDVNGDGFEDLLVGSATDQSGEACLYFGGVGMDSIPDLTFTPPSGSGFQDSSFGTSVCLGDLNGDDLSDVLIGAPLAAFRPGATFGPGIVYVYFGGAHLDTIPDLILAGTFTLEFFGWTESVVGDVNGDGFGDLVVGSPRFIPLDDPTVFEERGRAYLFLGGPGVDATADLILETPYPQRQFSSRFGSAISPAGDLNGDGVADFVVGHAQPPDYGLYARALVYLGSPSLDALADEAVLSSPFTNLQSQSVSPAGDFFADRRQGFAVTEPFVSDDGAFSAPGRVHVYAGMDSVPALILAGDPSEGTFGYAISGGKDVDGDDHPDLSISNPYSGRTYVFRGGVGADSIPDMILSKPESATWIGMKTALGDLNHDGVAEVMVAPQHFGPNLPGRVFIYNLARPLEARTFLCGAEVVRVGEGPRLVCGRLEPVGGSYSNGQVDLASLRLRSQGTGEAAEIPAISLGYPRDRDTDRNRVAEIGVWFRRDDLSSLFSLVEGRQRVNASLVGRLANGRRIQAPLSLTVIAPPKRHKPICRAFPNPANPQAVLSFETTAPGWVTVHLFDVLGRCVRTLVAGAHYDAGMHAVTIDGRDDRGGSLASGVYFYRIDGPDGRLDGRLVMAR